MGVDLRLLPFEADNAGGISFSHSILSLERRRELWDPIAKIEAAHGHDVPDGFCSFLSRGKDGDTCYGRTTTTPYGSRLKYVTAGDLKQLANHPAVTDNHINQAIWAYLACLPDSTKIALYWH
jgi:hypothetical protein